MPSSKEAWPYDLTRWLMTLKQRVESIPLVIGIGDIITGFTPGSVVFVGPLGSLAEDNAKLFWDDTNNRLGIGTNSPLDPLVVASADASGLGIAVYSAGAGISFKNNADSIQYGVIISFTVGTGGLIVSTNDSLKPLLLNSNDGPVGIGSATPTARLHLPAGTVVATRAPLKFTSGTLLGTPEAGAMEFLTDEYFVTITTGAARKGILLNNGTALTSGRVPFATTNGRLTDDADLTFATDTLTATKVLAPTSVSTPSLISTGALTVTPAAGSNLNVALSTTGDFAVNTDDLYVDTSAGRVGINITTPTQALSVVGEVDFYDGATLRGIVGPSSWGSTFFSFQNRTIAEAATNFAISQDSSGQTYLNAASGQLLFFRVSNTTFMAGNGNYAVIGQSVVSADFPGAGNSGLFFKDGTIPSSLGNNTAGLYADDVGGTVHMFAMSEAAVTMQLTGAANNTLAVAVQDLIVQLGKNTKYNAINTAGWGVPAIYASARATAQVAANASVATYTCGAADGSFLVSANVNVTTSTAHTFTVECAYTDETNTARVLTLPVVQLAGTIITAITNVTGAGPYEGIAVQIRCKASTAITIRTQAAGTYTTVTYNVEGLIQQVA